MEILQVIIALAILGMSNGAHPHHKAPLMGLSSEDRIPQEYIVLLKADISPLSTRLDAFQGYITIICQQIQPRLVLPKAA